MNSDKFTKDFMIDYIDINEDLTTSLTRLMNYVQETSLYHSLHAGYNMEYFTKNYVGFLLANWNVEVSKYPKWGEKIYIQTWPSKFRGILAERGFEIFDENKESILRAASRWVFTDLHKHKPIKIPEDMYNNYGKNFDGVMESDYKTPDLENFHKISETRFKVNRSDIDSNHHVNNIRYIGWAMDCTPENLYNNKKVTSFKVAYKKECTINTEINLELYQKNDDDSGYLYMINGAENPEITYCIVYTQWI